MFQRTRWWGRGGGRSFISIGLSYGKTTWFCCGGKVGQCETSDFHSIKWVHGNGIAAQWRIMCLWGCEHKTRDVSPSHWLTAFLVCFSCCNSVRKWHVPFSWWLIQHPLVTFITLFSFFFFLQDSQFCFWPLLGFQDSYFSHPFLFSFVCVKQQ